jgi:hypothetical protein
MQMMTAACAPNMLITHFSCLGNNVTNIQDDATPVSWFYYHATDDVKNLRFSENQNYMVVVCSK